MASGRSKRRDWLICFLFFQLFLTACSSVSSSAINDAKKTVPARSTTPSPLPLTYSCQLQQTPVLTTSMGPEIHGRSHESELWALLMARTVPPRVNEQVKIVWRMTGSGTLSLVALGPQGKRLQPDQGPEEHGGSNWNHPGGEWGSIFTFPSAGCWDLHTSRNGAFGDIWLTIT